MHCSVKARCVEHRHAKTAVHVLRLEGRERANVWGVLQETVVRKVSFYTSFVDTLPDSEKARLTVSVKLLDKAFSYDLTDKSSDKYKELKTTVVEALKLLLDVKLGPGNSGSIVVKYEVVVPKNESTAMQSNIVAAIKKHNGPFAGSTLDGNYVSIAKKEIEDSAFPWLPVILGVVSAVVVLIVVILLVVRKYNTKRLSDIYSDVDKQVDRYSTTSGTLDPPPGPPLCERSEGDNQWVSGCVLYYKQYQIKTKTRVHMFTFHSTCKRYTQHIQYNVLCH
ncbi:hypothetical protein NP493_66g06027 [Ridgeia piscesae]|uniref:Uncharacterized protein n=1 Tax=Ridgeia piscesae TaxID=27915 RepID=A0AAD9PAB8_RIDPI|nr:hypothetical protein NP493_66g06027 [Ridgeia piscesae]